MIQSASKRSAAFYARAFALAVLAGGVAVTLLAARASHQRHTRDVMHIFAAESEAMRQSVARQVQLFLEVLSSIGALQELSDTISADDFAELSEKGMAFQRRLLATYGFVQRVPHALRVEMQQRDAGLMRILETGANGAVVAAAERPEYFPLVSQQPPGALSFPDGMDVASLPGALETIVSMDARRGPAIARGLRIQDNSGESGYFIFSPLYDRRASEEGFLSGFTISILWPRQLLDRALADVAPRDVLVRFYDPETMDEPDAADAMAIKSPLNVADRAWTFETRPSDEYLAARASILPRVILLAGLAITVLLAATLWLLAGQTGRIENVVEQRTRDLKASMQERMRLEAEILDISEREKQTIGHDLHDSLGQKLTGAVYVSRALASRMAAHDEESRAQAAQINEILKDAVAQVRRMARGLSPVELGQEGLSGALQRLAEETSRIYNINCVFHHAGESFEPPRKSAHHMYAIALEGVNNAMRHGKATEVVLELSRHGDRGALMIEDNGRGFDPATTTSSGMGLRIMEHRASMMGGQLTVQRNAGGGTNIACTFPLPA